MGGPLIMKTAAAVPDRVGAAASFHGGGLVTTAPTSPHLLIPKMKARLYIGVATDDDMRDPKVKDTLKQAFADAKYRPKSSSTRRRYTAGVCRTCRCRRTASDLRQGSRRASVGQARGAVQGCARVEAGPRSRLGYRDKTIVISLRERNSDKALSSGHDSCFSVANPSVSSWVSTGPGSPLRRLVEVAEDGHETFRSTTVCSAPCDPLRDSGLSPAAQQKPLFSFHSNAWLNLHQFVRLAARGVAAEADYSSPEERAQWAKGVEFYAPYAKRDLLFDQGMVDIGTALRRAEGKPNLDGITIDANLKTTLERLMPIYQ